MAIWTITRLPFYFLFFFDLNEKFEILCSCILVLCSTMILVHFFFI